MEKDRVFINIIPHKIEYKGGTFLGIPTGITGKSFSLIKITGMKNNPGWIIRGDSIEEWKITGFCQYKNETYLYGRYIEGRSLEEVLTTEINEFLTFFYTLVSSLHTLYSYLQGYSKNHAQENPPFFRITTHSVFFLHDGGILFLPPDIMKELVELRPFKDKARVFSVCNHPDRTGEDNLSFSLGVFIYRIITGNYPFFSENEEELHNMIREMSIASPRIARPGLKNDVVQLITASLNSTGNKIPLLKTWHESMKIWIDQGIEQEISEEKKRIVKETEQQKTKIAAKRFRFKVSLRKNLVKIAAVFGVVFIIGSIVGFTLNRIFFRTRVTTGLSPLEVVQTYYNSINSLDHTTLSDCVTNDAGKGELHSVVNLYVITRQMAPYSEPIRFISADDWNKKGKPPLEPFTPMYGVTNVEIQKKRDEPEPVFIVSYEKWYTETEQTDPEFIVGTVKYFGSAITEQLNLKKDRNAWVIYKIEELEWEVIKYTPAD